MRRRKKLNLRDAAIFVLFLVLFFMAFPLLFMSISDVANGVSFWEAFSDNTLNGLLIDWIVIIAIFVKFLLEGKGTKKNLYMTFGMNKKAYYKMSMKENSIRACFFAIIRSAYLFMLCDTLEYYLSGDSVMIIGTIIYLLISGFMIYMILVMSKDILDSIHVSKKVKLIREESMTKTKRNLKRGADSLVFLHVMLAWQLCFAMHPLNFSILDGIFLWIGFRLDWFLPYRLYSEGREGAHLFYTILMIMCYIITLRLYKNENLKKQDWIE